jgi:alkaline phosphatase
LLINIEIRSDYPDYLWFPEVLVNVSSSAEKLAQDYFTYRRSNQGANMTTYLLDAVKENLGIKDVTVAEISPMIDNPDTAPYIFADIVSRRAQAGWTTHGHSGADVNIYTSDKKAAAALIGNHENTEVGKFLRDYLEVDLEPITQKLKEAWTQLDTVDAEGNVVSWMGPVPNLGERLDGQDHLDHYQGDFKKFKRSWTES